MPGLFACALILHWSTPEALAKNSPNAFNAQESEDLLDVPILQGIRTHRGYL
jgi:hypothetical protein